jgi:hypothetical protein
VTDDLNAILLRGIEQVRRGETIDRGDFSQYLGQETVYVAFQMGGSNEGVIESIHRTREAAEASFTCGKKHIDNWDPKPDYRQTGAAGEQEWHASNCTHHVVHEEELEGPSIPRRGDAVEQWLKAQRDQHREQTDDWFHIDGLLDEYRLHADTGTPLHQHVCEGNNNADDCHGCSNSAPPPHRARRSTPSAWTTSSPSPASAPIGTRVSTSTWCRAIGPTGTL